MAAVAHQRQKLCETIERWNATMMDIFAISLPDENTEFHGVIRFHLHEQIQNHQRQQQQSSPSSTTGALATKCMRVSSIHTVAHVVAALVSKFHAEANAMHMAATTPASASYSLWEVHDDDDNGTGGISERHMDAEERPLLVQLGWCCHNNGIASGNKERSDGSERCVPPSPMHNGRFVLRRRLPSAEFTRSVPRRFSKWRSGGRNKTDGEKGRVGGGTLMIVQFKKVRRVNKRHGAYHVDARASGVGHQNRPIVPKLSWGDTAEDGQDGTASTAAAEAQKKPSPVERELDQLDSIVVSAQQQADDDDFKEDNHHRVSGSAIDRRLSVDNVSSASYRNKLPASMVAAAQQLERQSKSLAALSLLDTSMTSLPSPPRCDGTSVVAELQHRNRHLPQQQGQPTAEGGNDVRSAEVQQNEQRRHQKQPPPAVPAKPAIRELLHPVPTKKHVQFSIQNNENILLEKVPPAQQKMTAHKDNNGTDNYGTKTATDEEEEEPRVQIVGAHEVYVNDPRQVQKHDGAGGGGDADETAAAVVPEADANNKNGVGI